MHAMALRRPIGARMSSSLTTRYLTCLRRPALSVHLTSRRSVRQFTTESDGLKISLKALLRRNALALSAELFSRGKPV